MKFGVTIIIEGINIVVLCSQDTPIGCMYNYVAFYLVAYIDETYYSGYKNETLKKRFNDKFEQNYRPKIEEEDTYRSG